MTANTAAAFHEFRLVPAFEGPYDVVRTAREKAALKQKTAPMIIMAAVAFSHGVRSVKKTTYFIDFDFQ